MSTDQAHEPDGPLSPFCLEMRCVLRQVTVATGFDIRWSVDSESETISFEVIHPDILIYAYTGGSYLVHFPPPKGPSERRTTKPKAISC